MRLTGLDAAGNKVTKWMSGEQIRFSSSGLACDPRSSTSTSSRPPGAPPSPSPSPTPTDLAHRRAAAPARRSTTPAHQGDVPEDGFSDVNEGTTHEYAIDCVVWWEVAKGVGDGRFDPNGSVRRDQMATFMREALTAAGYPLPAEPADAFVDDDGTVHEHAIDQLAAIGLVSGTDAEARTYGPAASR